ncbi:MAG: phosphatidylglycerophosphatase [Wolbachia endosymbiont of Fragariocoptes setiger]|nr:phosphatidylglycerophosphatase [Wolbachia endosymbiont of Fragariocoptes setiger]
MKKTLAFFGKILGKVFPGKTISSFFGTGYLPAWQGHWASFLALFIVYISLILVYEGKHLLNTLPTISGIVFAAIFMKLAIIMIIIQVVGIFVLHSQDPSANSDENIVVHMASGQILTVAFSLPAIISIFSTIVKMYNGICKQMLHCPSWFNDFMSFMFLFMIPYFYFNVLEVIKPWPISSLQLGYNNAISITTEGVVYTLYATILLYLTAFLCCDLTMTGTIAFNTNVIWYVYEDFLAFKQHLWSFF